MLHTCFEFRNRILKRRKLSTFNSMKNDLGNWHEFMPETTKSIGREWERCSRSFHSLVKSNCIVSSMASVLIKASSYSTSPTWNFTFTLQLRVALIINSSQNTWKYNFAVANRTKMTFVCYETGWISALLYRLNETFGLWLSCVSTRLAVYICFGLMLHHREPSMNVPNLPYHVSLDREFPATYVCVRFLHSRAT